MIPAPTTRNPDDRAIGYWLLACCVILFALVMLGGATRLTGSGLSIVDWKPVTGVLPPLTDAAWQAEIELYRQSPEYQQVNRGMSMAEFKRIFYYEYAHRLLARSLGLAFALPLFWFWWRGRIGRHLRWPLIGIFALGAAQGYMGWYMVQSGLVDIPRVSPYRLAAHLSLALVIHAAMFALALRLLWPQRQPAARLGRGAVALLTMVSITIVSGAFVAGLKAGFIYNTFPLMAGAWVPAGLWHMQPAWLNLLENPLTVQFTHRCLALATFAGVLALWLGGLRGASRTQRLALHALAATTLMQVALGIATLLLQVPVWLGTLHQGGAVVLLSAVLVVAHVCRRQPVTQRAPLDVQRAAAG
jgi:heme a synthase